MKLWLNKQEKLKVLLGGHKPNFYTYTCPVYNTTPRQWNTKVWLCSCLLFTWWQCFGWIKPQRLHNSLQKGNFLQHNVSPVIAEWLTCGKYNNNGGSVCHAGAASFRPHRHRGYTLQRIQRTSGCRYKASFPTKVPVCARHHSWPYWCFPYSCGKSFHSVV